MKKVNIILIGMICLCHVFAIGQHIDTNQFSKFKGFTLSQKNGILAKGNFINAVYPSSNDVNHFSANSEVVYDFHAKVANSMTVPMAVCNDAAGNLYITGKSGNVATKSGDITTFKVNSLGEIVWTIQVPSPEFTVNAGTSIVRDENGFIYVLGYLWNQTSTDITCLKISSTGQIIWQTTIGEQNKFEVPTALTVSQTGDVYIAGITNFQSTVTHYVSKLNPNGSIAWQYTDIDFPNETWNEPKLIEVDNNNNVVVCGSGIGEDFKVKVVTTKLDSSGSVLWRVLKGNEILIGDEPTTTDVWPKDLVIDDQNYMYIVSNYSDDFDHSLTFKYDANGSENWTFTHQMPDESTIVEKIAIVNNNLYLGGYHNGNGVDGFVLYNLSQAGIENWVQSTEEGLYFQSSFSMTTFQDKVTLDALFTSLEPSESTLKSRKYLASSGDLNQSTEYLFNNVQLGFSIESLLNPIIEENSKTIVFNPTYSDKGNILEVIKLDSLQNNIEWNLKYAPENSLRANIYESVSDSNSNVYTIISKFYVQPTNLNTIFQKSYLLKYSDQGQLLNSITLDDSQNIANLKLRIDQDDNVIILKRLAESQTISLQKFSSNLEEIWNNSFLIPANADDKIIVDNQNNIYIINSQLIATNTNESRIFVNKYNTNGLLVYTRIYEPEDGNITLSYASNVKINNSRELIISGVSTDGTIHNFNFVYKPFLLKVKSNGDMVYFKHYLIPGTTASVVDASFSDNDIFLTVNTRAINTGNFDVKLLKIGLLGGVVWQQNYTLSNTNIYVNKVLLSAAAGKLFLVTTNLSEVSGNIQVSSHDLNGNFITAYDIEENNYYQDAFTDNQNVFVLSQSQDALNFPFRLLNWLGPYISSKVTKLSHELEFVENQTFMGPNYSLYEPKQLIPLANAKLLISGRLFIEEHFYEGLQFYSMPYEPLLNLPTLPDNQQSKLYCFPNPFKDVTNLFVNNNTDEIKNLMIYDVHGRIIKQLVKDEISLRSNQIEVDLKHLNSGIYFVKVNTENEVYTTKIIKQ